MPNTPLLAHFLQMTRYNRWANDRLYEDAEMLPLEALTADVGVYFKSLFATLSHMLQSDRAWTFMLQGGALDHMVLQAAPATLGALRAARCEEDDKFVDWIDTVDEAWLAEPFVFVSGLGRWRGMTYRGTRGSTLTHVLNHQTHHRGQAHTALSLLGVGEPRALDILVKGFLGE